MKFQNIRGRKVKIPKLQNCRKKKKKSLRKRMAPNISAATLKRDQWLQNSGAKIICNIDPETKTNHWSSLKVE